MRDVRELNQETHEDLNMKRGRPIPDVTSRCCVHRQQIATLTAEVEAERLRLAACGVVAMQNTESSRGARLQRDHPYWSASYQDVCNAVDREIALRSEVARLRGVVEAALEKSHSTIWDAYYGKGLAMEYVQNTSRIIKDALAALTEVPRG